ncbi:uncharacterized protein LOC135847042 [Planococcus citri]|uniref:uncharacterized protein LOC135847042 n=1 Tax=Planococcus citri TaxID=170843 RepID=UPI0031FA058F
MKTIVIFLIIAFNIQCESSASKTRAAEAKKQSQLDHIELSYDEWNYKDYEENEKVRSSESSSSSDDSSDYYSWSPKGENKHTDRRLDTLSTEKEIDSKDANETVPVITTPNPNKTVSIIVDLPTIISGDEDGIIKVDGHQVGDEADPELVSNQTLRILASNKGIYINDRSISSKTWDGDSMAKLNITARNVTTFSLQVFSDGSLNYTDSSTLVNIFYSAQGNDIIPP